MINTHSINANDIHTAISSWSGFVYQGKVAIYHVLRLLLEDINASNYKLQLDSLDDFAIINSDTSRKSLHQVKALQSTNYSTYKEAFEKLVDRVSKYPSENAYFHVTGLLDLSSDEIEKKHQPIRIYSYRSGNYYCKLDEIDKHIEEVITEYLIFVNRQHLSNPDSVKLFRNCIEDLILKQVIRIHAENQEGRMTIREGAFNLTIPINDFERILNQDLSEWALCDDYFCNMLRQDINRYFQEFIVEQEQTSTLESEVKLLLRKYIIHICTLSTPDLVKFIKLILPHRKVEFKTIHDYGNVAFRDEELKDAFFFMLKEIKNEANINLYKFSWCNSKSRYNFIPSLINASGDRQADRTCRQIVETVINSDIEVAYESQKIITSELDIESVFDHANHNMRDLPLQNANEKKRITSWGNVSLVSIETAKNILND